MKQRVDNIKEWYRQIKISIKNQKEWIKLNIKRILILIIMAKGLDIKGKDGSSKKNIKEFK